MAFGSGSLQADPTVPIDRVEPSSRTPAAVWFEGTAQLALALANRNRKGDKAAAQQLLDSVIWAQSELGQGQQFGSKRIEGAWWPHRHRCRPASGSATTRTCTSEPRRGSCSPDPGVNPYLF